MLVDRFWDGRRGLFRVSTAALRRPGPWHYWWQAHALDCVLDAVARGQAAEAERAGRLVRGILARNGGTPRNDYHDDLAWFALALDRARAVAGLDTDALVAGIWADLRAGWGGPAGGAPGSGAAGGIVWRRGDTYRNAPTNGPAAVLACRRYRAGGDPADLAWARRLASWLLATLVDADGVVWDGIHPGDPAPHRERYSYNQGTVAGAFAELGELSGEAVWRERALRVARAGLPLGVLPDEGGGDRALFKGIYARYAAALGDPGLTAGLAACGEALWAARGRGGLCGPSWTVAPRGAVELSAHLSGVLLFGALATPTTAPGG